MISSISVFRALPLSGSREAGRALCMRRTSSQADRATSHKTRTGPRFRITSSISVLRLDLGHSAGLGGSRCRFLCIRRTSSHPYRPISNTPTSGPRFLIASSISALHLEEAQHVDATLYHEKAAHAQRSISTSQKRPKADAAKAVPRLVSTVDHALVFSFCCSMREGSLTTVFE